MIRSLLIAVLLGLIGCGETSGPDVSGDAHAVEPAKSPGETSEPQPSTDSTTHNAEIKTATEEIEATPTPSKREVVRRRCKPGYTPCHGGRECCNDLFEVCGKDFRCHPLE